MFIRKTRGEKISSYGDYLCACMCFGEITGEEAESDLKYYITTLEDKNKKLKENIKLN